MAGLSRDALSADIVYAQVLNRSYPLVTATQGEVACPPSIRAAKPLLQYAARSASRQSQFA